MKHGLPWFSISFFDPDERATRGFDDLHPRGVVVVPDCVLRPKPFGLPGVYNFGGTYSSAQYRSTDPEAYLDILGQAVADRLANLQVAVAGPLETGSWSLYGNFYQAIFVNPEDEKGTAGVFGSVGLSDGQPNPVRYTATIGFSGRSMIRCRPIDTFGVGFFYTGLSDDFKRLTRLISPQRHERGVEMFYNYAINPWARLTTDFQVVLPSTRAFDTALIGTLRLQLRF